MSLPKEVVLSAARFCLRCRKRRQARAAYGGRFARLDRARGDEAWLGIGCVGTVVVLAFRAVIQLSGEVAPRAESGRVLL